MQHRAVFFLLLVLTACQPATPQPATTTAPITTPSPTNDVQATKPPGLPNQITIEEGACCISAQAGESLTLHIDLSSFELQAAPDNMRLVSVYKAFSETWYDTVTWRAEWQPYTPSTEMAFEVLPGWNKIRVCAQVAGTNLEVLDSDCSVIAILGASEELQVTTAQVNPKELEAGTQLELPAWLGDPQVPVFAVIREKLDEHFAISFFNVETEERFDLVITATAAYFWTPDGLHFGLVEEFSERTHIIDMRSGIITSYSLDMKNIAPLLDTEDNSFDFKSFPNPAPEPIFANNSDPANPEFQLAVREDYWEIAYTVSINPWDEAAQNFMSGVVVANHQTGEHYVLTDPQDGNANLDVDFSPANNRIAVVQGVDIDGMGQTGDHLLIFSAETGEKLAEYEGPYFRARWSPDGKQILYTTSAPRSEGLARPDIAPCILSVATGESFCITDITRRFEKTEGVFVARYDWSANGERIYFIYESPLLNSDGLDMGQRFGNYCYYQLDSDDLQCPDEELFEGLIEASHIYALSPDEQYIAVDHGGCTSWGDDGCPSQISVFGIENDVYINLGYRDVIEVKLGDDWDLPRTYAVLSHASLLWRPAIQP